MRTRFLYGDIIFQFLMNKKRKQLILKIEMFLLCRVCAVVWFFTCGQLSIPGFPGIGFYSSPQTKLVCPQEIFTKIAAKGDPNKRTPIKSYVESPKIQNQIWVRILFSALTNIPPGIYVEIQKLFKVAFKVWVTVYKVQSQNRM